MPLYISISFFLLSLVVISIFVYLTILDLDNRKKHKALTASKVKSRQYKKETLM